MFNSEALRPAQRLIILGILTFALGFLIIDQSVVQVRAGNCFDASMVLSDCNSACDTQYVLCGNDPSCQTAVRSCLMSCNGDHQQMGIDCNFAPYSHPLDPNENCNGQQLYDNCMAGTNVPLNVRDVYLDCMAENGGDSSNIPVCCEETRDAWLAIGCY